MRRLAEPAWGPPIGKVLAELLRENRQLRVRGIEELSRRTRLRWLAATKSAEARGQIETYLQAFPMNTEKERKALRAIGLDGSGGRFPRSRCG